jgi:CheY-like chemotaxis protein
VLVAFEEDDRRKEIVAMLGRQGCLVAQTSTGGNVPSLAAAEPRPDTVILGARLPVRTGLALCDLLRRDARTHDIPVIIVTATYSQEFAESAVKAGAKDLLLEPVSEPMLVRKLKGTLRFHRAVGRARTGVVTAPEHPLLLVRRLRCSFHPAATAFGGYWLRGDAPKGDLNLYDVPIYPPPAQGVQRDWIDYTRLEARVCPDCFFASTEDALFIQEIGPLAGKSVVPEAAASEAVARGRDARRELVARSGPRFWDDGRSVEDAVLAYQLAVQSERALLASDAHTYAAALTRIGNDYLKIAQLHAGLDELEQEETYLRFAYEALFETRSLGAYVEADRTLYQLVTLAHVLEEGPVAQVLMKDLRHRRERLVEHGAPRTLRERCDAYLAQAEASLATEPGELRRGALPRTT